MDVITLPVMFNWLVDIASAHSKRGALPDELAIRNTDDPSNRVFLSLLRVLRLVNRQEPIVFALNFGI